MPVSHFHVFFVVVAAKAFLFLLKPPEKSKVKALQGPGP